MANRRYGTIRGVLGIYGIRMTYYVYALIDGKATSSDTSVLASASILKIDKYDIFVNHSKIMSELSELFAPIEYPHRVEYRHRYAE